MEPDILSQSVTDLFLAAAPASPWVTSEECTVPLPLPALETALGALGKSVKEWFPLPVWLRWTLFAATYAGAALLLLRSWRRSGEEGGGRTTEVERNTPTVAVIVPVECTPIRKPRMVIIPSPLRPHNHNDTDEEENEVQVNTFFSEYDKSNSSNVPQVMNSPHSETQDGPVEYSLSFASLSQGESDDGHRDSEGQLENSDGTNVLKQEENGSTSVVSRITVTIH